MEKQFNDFAYQVFASRMFAIPDARLGWDAGVQAERERIRARVRLTAISSWSASEVYIGPPLMQLQKFVDRLLEDSDE